jgi:hypothetical protein
LTVLFFSSWVSIRITDGISILGKDQINTSVKFSVQKLTVCRVYKLPSSVSPNPLSSRCCPSPPPHNRILCSYVLSSSHAPSASVGERTSLGHWHSGLGHPTLRVCFQVITKFHLPVLKNNASVSCSTCHLSKSKHLSFPLSSTHVNNRLELIYTDVWGPSPMLSSQGNKYYVSFLDAHSRNTLLFPMSNKSDVCNIFLQFQKNVERLISSKIKIIQFDRGGEFCSPSKILQNIGLVWQTIIILPLFLFTSFKNIKSKTFKSKISNQ